MDKVKELLNKTAEKLSSVKEELEKDFSGFGTAIGGGTDAKPTIKPTKDTSADIRSKSGWFGQCEDTKENVSLSKNGQWSIDEIKEDGKEKKDKKE